MDSHSICVPLYKEFEDLFSKTFYMKEKYKLFAYLQKQSANKNWKSLLGGFKKYVDIYLQKVQDERTRSGNKRKNPLYKEEGAFVFALRNGERILLYEHPKPVLLEGSPGVGKTSSILALGKCSRA